MSGKWLLFFKLGSLWSWKLSSTAGNWYSPLLKLSNSTCFYLTSALRAQVKHMTDCKRKCSLFINARCSVNLQVLAFEANPRSLFSFHRDHNDALGQASFFPLCVSVQLNSVCILRFYQIRASLKVPPRVPHKVETSLLHPGGKGTCAVIWYHDFIDLNLQLVFCTHFLGGLHTQNYTVFGLRYLSIPV